ncbi:MAG TPA: hypothetical protein VMH04_13530 [Candidatus Solibacter sp.]|nr:hypothetical protein [Candidatus Solibacter sp.]
MSFRLSRAVLLLAVSLAAAAQSGTPNQSSSKSKPVKVSPNDSALDPGILTGNTYRNRTLGLTYKIPDGWVLRTEELNGREGNPLREGNASQDKSQEKKDRPRASPQPASSAGAKVLLAAFSRPPEAKGEEINSSVLIAAEAQSSYPGLKDALQYLDPITEVAKAQGFTQDEDPYEIAVGAKTLVRADFHKDVGTRVMRQSTLAMLVHGYAISITVIAGTEDDAEELIDNLDFSAAGK